MPTHSSLFIHTQASMVLSCCSFQWLIYSCIVFTVFPLAFILFYADCQQGSAEFKSLATADQIKLLNVLCSRHMAAVAALHSVYLSASYEVVLQCGLMSTGGAKLRPSNSSRVNHAGNKTRCELTRCTAQLSRSAAQTSNSSADTTHEVSFRPCSHKQIWCSVAQGGWAQRDSEVLAAVCESRFTRASDESSIE